MDKKDLIAKAHTLKPFTQIGSAGVSDGATQKILLYLKKHKLGKIKILDSALDSSSKQEITNSIIEKTKASLISSIGKTVVLWKR